MIRKNRFIRTSARKYIIGAALMLSSAILPIGGSLSAGAATRDKQISHPSLLFTSQRVKDAKSRVKADSIQAKAYDSIIARADALLDKNDHYKMEYLALAYLLTSDKRYMEKLRSMLDAISEIDSWADKEMMMRDPAWRSELQMAHKSFQIAMAYDAIYNDLTPKQRKKIAEGVFRLAIEPLLGDWLTEPTRIHSLNSMGHNWWSSCVGMGGLFALAISNEVPEAQILARKAVEAIPEWFDFAGDRIQNKPKTFDREGGMYESVNYASFGITEALLLRLAWLNSHPGEDLEEIPQMSRLADFFIQVGYPREEGIFYSLNFGDSHKNVTGESSMLLAYAMGEKNPDVKWYVNQLTEEQHREGFPRSFPMGFLYTPDLKDAPVLPSSDLDRVWEDFGWATMRDSYMPDATMLAVKSGMTWNHAHADAGSIILFHNGEDIIKDAGNCSYGRPEYRNYFFQSDAHNIVKFNGKGQSAYQQYHGTMLPGYVGGLTSGNGLKYVMADATGPTSDNFARNQRHYLWIDNVILIIDDLKSHETGSFEWLWHPGGDVRKVGGDLVISKGKSAAVIRPLYPQPLAPSNFVHDYPEMLYWDVMQGPTEDLKGTEEYYSLKLPAKTDRIKGVTAIILKDSPQQSTLPTIKRIQGKNWIGLEITDTIGKTTKVYINELADGRLMHLNSWINADGYDTDAYIFVDSPDKQFIAYGSALRKNGRSIFSSLSKLNFLSVKSDNTTEISINGQPRIRATYSPEKRPARISVNGNTTDVSYHDGVYLLRTKR